MRKIPAALKAHLDGLTTTTCLCWRLTRKDGTVLGFTDHDEAIAFDATVFEAASGLSASEAEAEIGFSAGAQEVDGALSSLAIEEKDIIAGRYDGAAVETFLVNWEDVEERLSMDVAELGEVKRNGTAFTAELRGISAQLDQRRGRLYRRRCDARFGDLRCGIDTAQSRYFADATMAGLEPNGALVLSGAGAVDAGLFEHGRIAWRSGAAGGLAADIASLGKTGGGVRVSLLGGPLPGAAAGDAVRLHAGCDKTFATCRARFANGLNFRGFPHLPGNDTALAIAKKDGRHDGSPVVP